MSQSYFRWKRVSYRNIQHLFLSCSYSRNPTFAGSGFHIKAKYKEQLELAKVAILLSLEAGFIFKEINVFHKAIMSQSYFRWKRVSYKHSITLKNTKM